METLTLLLQIVVIFIVALLASQYFTKRVVGVFLERITEAAKALKGKDDYKDSEVEKEIAVLFAIRASRGKLGFITQFIGIVEIVVFGILTVLIFEGGFNGLLDKAGAFSNFVVGWMAIKAIGNYRQWTGPVFGRAVFYVFMIGTFLNVFIAVGTGVMSSLLFK